MASTTARDQGVLLDRMVKGCTDAAEAAALGATPELCRLAIDILTWQRLRNLIPSLLPQKAKVANKTGRGPRGRMDAGVVFGRQAAFIIRLYRQLPDLLPDGCPATPPPRPPRPPRPPLLGHSELT